MITLTETAIEKAKEHLEGRGNGVGIRFGVTTTGCSGLAYIIEFCDSVLDTDVVQEQDGLKLVIDKKHLAYIEGSNVDYVKEGLNEGFEFSNPNMKAECGCGESFTV
jgi:iron-sulfur cluster assembly protein